MAEEEIPDTNCNYCLCEEWLLHPDKDYTAYCLKCGSRIEKGQVTGFWSPRSGPGNL